MSPQEIVEALARLHNEGFAQGRLSFYEATLLQLAAEEIQGYIKDRS